MTKYFYHYKPSLHQRLQDQKAQRQWPYRIGVFIVFMWWTAWALYILLLIS